MKTKNPTQSKNIYSLLLWLCVQCGYAVDRPDAEMTGTRTKQHADNTTRNTSFVTQSQDGEFHIKVEIPMPKQYQQQMIQSRAPLAPQFPALSSDNKEQV